MISYLEIIMMTLIPSLTAVLLFQLDRKGKFDKISPSVKVLLIGIIFGLLAIASTEFGLQAGSAQITSRDACVVLAGLIFGAPAGLIAGCIGALERFLSCYWGVCPYTQISGTVATLFAGVFSALVNHFMLEKKRPTVWMALFISISAEIFHMIMIFFTHMHDLTTVSPIIEMCSGPQIVINSLSVFLAVYLIALLTHDLSFLKFRPRSEIPVFDSIQEAMMAVICICLIVSGFYINRLESNLGEAETEVLLQNAVTDCSTALKEEVVYYLTTECRLLWNDLEINKIDPDTLAEKHHIKDWYTVDNDGKITGSNNKNAIGRTTKIGEYSSDFECLLNGETDYYNEYETPYYYQLVVGIATTDGYLQASWTDDGLQAIVSEQIDEFSAHTHVGQSGSIIIADKNGDIISTPESLPSDAFDKAVTADGKTVILSDENEYYYASQTCAGYNIVAFYPVSASNMRRQVSVYLALFLIIQICMAIYLLLYIVMRKIVVKQIVQMASSLSRISSGKLDEVVNVRNNAEFSSLSNDINHTVDTLKTYIAEASARIDAELEAAAQIQLAALPDPNLLFGGRNDFQIYAEMKPAKEVGGDFYDFYLTGENELNIMIADVSGKGIPAALFMMRAKSTLKAFAESGFPVNEVFYDANNRLCDGNTTDMFVTAWQATIHLDTGLMEFVNAGHNAPLIRHANGQFEYLKQKRNLVLAAMEDIPYRKNVIQLEPGDVILLYTDGVVEATNSLEVLYGDDRLQSIVNSRKFTSMKEMVEIIRRDVDRFVGNAPQFDDMTMLAFKYTRNENE